MFDASSRDSVRLGYLWGALSPGYSSEAAFFLQTDRVRLRCSAQGLTPISPVLFFPLSRMSAGSCVLGTFSRNSMLGRVYEVMTDI